MSTYTNLFTSLLLTLPPNVLAYAGTPAAIAVPQCTKVTLSAAYLAEVTPHGGPGFLLTLSNETDTAIKLALPVPTSAHWYGRTANGRWQWRASTGTGGGLVNALNEHGPVLAYSAAALGSQSDVIMVSPHTHLDRTVSVHDNPILRFRPGCERCRNPDDKQFRAILAYADLPPSGQSTGEWLACGLRSNLVVMPPLE